jgi:hypothetical protein
LLLAYFFIFLNTPQKINLDDLSIYNMASAFKLDSHFLFISRSESTIAIVNMDGDAKTYKREGQGPDDLFGPYILGFDEKEIIVVSNQSNLISFDYNLQPDSDKYPSLPDEVVSLNATYGLPLDEKRFHLIGSSRSAWLKSVIEMGHNEWIITKKGWPNETRKSTDRLPPRLLLKIHNNKLFLTHNKYEEPPYRISVYPLKSDIDTDSDILMILENDKFDEFKTYAPYTSAKIYIKMALATSDGYAVIFSAKKIGQDHSANFVDIYGPMGGFQKRIELDYLPIPCFNCPEVFLVENIEGQEYLTPWTLPFRN